MGVLTRDTERHFFRLRSSCHARTRRQQPCKHRCVFSGGLVSAEPVGTSETGALTRHIKDVLETKSKAIKNSASGCLERDMRVPTKSIEAVTVENAADLRQAVSSIPLRMVLPAMK